MPIALSDIVYEKIVKNLEKLVRFSMKLDLDF